MRIFFFFFAQRASTCRSNLVNSFKTVRYVGQSRESNSCGLAVHLCSDTSWVLSMMLAAFGSLINKFYLIFFRCFSMIDNSSFEATSELDSTTMKADQRHSLEGMMGMGVASTFHAILMQSSPKIFQVKFYPSFVCLFTTSLARSFFFFFPLTHSQVFSFFCAIQSLFFCSSIN